MIDKKEIAKEIDKEYLDTINYKNKKEELKDKPKILLCTPEITELPNGFGNAANFISAKGGGLGDISASLVKYLKESRLYNIHIALPKYDKKIKDVYEFSNTQIDRLAIILSGKGIHLVNDSAFSYLTNPYAENRFHSAKRRALAFQREIINYLLDEIKPDIVHCNDWMTALVPAAAKAKGIKSVFTLHNIFTEKITLMDIELSGIRPMEFVENLYFEEFPENIRENWERYFTTNRVDFTASAIFSADYFNTVSPTFLKELVDDIFPELVPRSIYRTIVEKYNQGKAVGILNAPNDTIHPKILKNIINFDISNVEKYKPQNKALFQEKMNLEKNENIPLFFWPNRLFYQKSPDLLVQNAEYLIKKYGIQIAIVANGDSDIEKQLKELSAKLPGKLSYKPFNEELSTLGKAGADFILMPSRYEPCGLPQMEAPRLGTLPVVRATGGLKDTVTQLDPFAQKGNGFIFEILDKIGFEFAVSEAVKFFNLPKDIKISNIKRIMAESLDNFNMQKTANKYMEIYDKLLENK